MTNFKKGDHVMVVTSLPGEAPFISERETVHSIRSNGRVSLVGGGGMNYDEADVFHNANLRGAYARLAARLETFAAEKSAQVAKALNDAAAIREALAAEA